MTARTIAIGSLLLAAGCALAILIFGPAGCGGSAPPASSGPKITLESKALPAGQPIPKRHTEDGEDLSPPLSWSGLPAGTRELALIVDDPDAPSPQPWVHWAIYKIPASATGLPEGVPATEVLAEPPGALQGRNSWGATGWRGPAPPPGHGVHHYHFRIYALDAALDLKPGLVKAALLAAMKGHIIAEGELVATYQR